MIVFAILIVMVLAIAIAIAKMMIVGYYNEAGDRCWNSDFRSILNTSFPFSSDRLPGPGLLVSFYATILSSNDVAATE